MGSADNNLDPFIALVKKYMDILELAPTILNEFIKKIIVYTPDKISGKRTQEIRTIFNFLDEMEMPSVNEAIATDQNTLILISSLHLYHISRRLLPL